MCLRHVFEDDASESDPARFLQAQFMEGFGTVPFLSAYSGSGLLMLTVPLRLQSQKSSFVPDFGCV